MIIAAAITPIAMPALAPPDNPSLCFEDDVEEEEEFAVFEIVDEDVLVEAVGIVCVEDAVEANTDAEHEGLAKAQGSRHPYWHPFDTRQL